jgi:hypothetical protein
VHVHNTVDALIFLLKLGELPQRTQIIAYMYVARGLYARKNPHSVPSDPHGRGHSAKQRQNGIPPMTAPSDGPVAFFPLIIYGICGQVKWDKPHNWKILEGAVAISFCFR